MLQQKKPSLVLRMLPSGVVLRGARLLHLKNLHASSVLQGVDPDHKSKWIRSEEAKVRKAGKSAQKDRDTEFKDGFGGL